jgi:hypothetical protein
LPGGSAILAILIACLLLLAPSAIADEDAALVGPEPSARARQIPLELPRDPPASPALLELRSAAAPAEVQVGLFQSVQVNVNALGDNIVGDAANEPSIAISPVDPSRIVIGWRQFDSVLSDFREAGYAFSGDAGETWTFPGVLEEGVFRSDPVLGADADGSFYYYSMTLETDPYQDFRVHLFKSLDGGVTWLSPVDAFGGDKPWMTIDRTQGVGRGNIYGSWSKYYSCCPPSDFSRSIDGGASFETPLDLPAPKLVWGTLDVGPDGTLYLAGVHADGPLHVVGRSSNARDPGETPVFELVQQVNLGGETEWGGVNPDGLLGHVWLATDHSGGPNHGNVYVLASVDPPGPDPVDVHFIRSTDGGETWSDPVRVNDDPADSGAWQWFGTMSVAPNGRIDAIWNDTRNDPGNFLSEVFYSYSIDSGETWSTNQAITPPFDPSLGYPQQAKLGDYYHMISDDEGASLAYAATFNGEQDVYFLRIPAASAPCNDGLDNDGDGRIDFDPVTFANPGDEYTPPSGSGDPGCKDPSWFTENPRCQDGTDTDGDGAMDYDAGLSRNGSAHPAGPDPQCVGRPYRNCEKPICGCGLGVELALLLPSLIWLRSRRQPRPSQQ